MEFGISTEEKVYFINNKIKKLDSFTIPSTITYDNQTYSVTEIDPQAFWGKNYKKIIIPDSITKIPDCAFNCCETLESINANKVKYIGVCAFQNCKNLKEIHLANDEIEVGNCAFNLCKNLEFYCGKEKNKIKLKGPIIYEGAFSQCAKLEVVEALQTKSIGKSAFSNCTNLQKIYLSAENLEVGDSAFSECKNLEFCCGKEEKNKNKIKLAGTTISKGAFNLCEKLELVEAFQAQNIMSMAFQGCENLKQIFLPNKLQKVEDYAFFRCEKLNFNCNKEKNTIKFYGTKVPTKAFFLCRQIENVEIQNATIIERFAFYGCSNIRKIKAPNLKNIEDCALEDCISLQDLEIPLKLNLKLNQEKFFGNNGWQWFYPLILKQESQLQEIEDKNKLKQKTTIQPVTNKNSSNQIQSKEEVKENYFDKITNQKTQDILNKIFLNKKYNKDQIEFLDLSDTEIENIDNLHAFFPKLTTLKLKNTKVKDLTPLKQFECLQDVYLDNTQINDDAILVLSAIKTLQRISLSNTGITNVNRLCDLGELTHLYLSGTAIKIDISQFKTLVHLDLSNTIIDELDNFKNETLQYLNLSETNINFNLIKNSVEDSNFQKLNNLIVENMLWQQTDQIKNQIVEVKNMCKQSQINFDCTLIDNVTLDFKKDYRNVGLKFILDKSGMNYNIENLQLKVSLLAKNQYDKMGDTDQEQFQKVVFAINENNFQTLHAHMINVQGIHNKVLSLDFNNVTQGRGNARIYVEKINGVLYLQKINFKHMK